MFEQHIEMKITYFIIFTTLIKELINILFLTSIYNLFKKFDFYNEYNSN